MSLELAGAQMESRGRVRTDRATLGHRDRRLTIVKGAVFKINIWLTQLDPSPQLQSHGGELNVFIDLISTLCC